ncbi:MAG: PhzF family phenazine biosynthesis protein [Pseudomonadota bacterium]
MKLRFATLDVFTETRFAGNPLAVVHDADGLSDEQMQAVAREFNLSETVFVMAPERPVHAAKIRIFTPAAELPFAGHPTVGTAIHLAALKRQDAEAAHEAIIALEEKIGTVRVGVRFAPDRAPFAEFDVPQLPQEIGEAPSVERIADALDLLPSEIGFQNHKPARYSAGVPFTYVPVVSREAIARARPNMQAWSAAFGSAGHNAAYVYTREAVHATSSFHARMFAPGGGIYEDPATGSAAAGFASVVMRFDTPMEGWHRRIIEQGYEMGRPSEIVLSLEVQQNKLETVRIGGGAVSVTEGTIEV